MKKYMDKLNTVKATDLQKQSIALRAEITDLRRGIKTGDVQNTQAVRAKRKELARVLTLLAKPVVEEPVKEAKVKKAAKPAAKKVVAKSVNSRKTQK